MTCVAYIGRFQPFHIGHAHVIKELHDEGYELIRVIIGSAQETYTPNNPFTIDERKQMIKIFLSEHPEIQKITRIEEQDDDPDDSEWVNSIVEKVGFSDIASNNPDTIKLFEDNGFKVYRPFYRLQYNGKNIRRIMCEGGKYDDLVSVSTLKFLNTINANERLQKIYGDKL